MESVARQFIADGDKAVVVRNGWFSYRWTQIIERGKLTADENVTVLKARRVVGALDYMLSYYCVCCC